MSQAAQNRSDKKSDETGASIKNERETPTSVQTVEALLSGNVDPVYAAKAQVLNDAIQSIGMGRYQVIPSFPFFHRAVHPSVTMYCRAHYMSFIVGLVHCSWIWILCG